MQTMSTITLLPSNDQELETYVDNLRREILVMNDPLKTLRQLHYALRTITEVISDKEINRAFYLHGLSFGKDVFRYAGTTYELDHKTESVRVVEF